MISYEQILLGVIIIFFICFAFSYIQVFRHRKNDKVRRKYMYLVIVFSVFVQVAFFLRIKFKDTSKEGLKPEIQTQLEKLDEIEKSLSDLKSFVESQKVNLRESEIKIKELNEEREKLKPIVEADRKAIESLFLIQEERNRSKVWFDRFIGVFFGVLSSLTAAFIYRLIATKRSNAD